MKKTNGWFLANLSNGEKQIYTVQKRDINIEIVKTTIYSILDRDSPFFTKCGIHLWLKDLADANIQVISVTTIQFRLFFIPRSVERLVEGACFIKH